MTTTRSLALALAVAAFAAGCGDNKNCSDATPPVKNTPASCTAVVGSPLNVPINTCPRCDQATPTCDVHSPGGGAFTLEPVSQVCDPNSSCPIPDIPSCAAAPVQCTLSAALTQTLDPNQSYTLNIVNENGGVIARPLTVVASGSAGCTP
jgi:hypothetical protein